jgi:hypothetical protein
MFTFFDPDRALVISLDSLFYSRERYIRAYVLKKIRKTPVGILH